MTFKFVYLKYSLYFLPLIIQSLVSAECDMAEGKKISDLTDRFINKEQGSPLSLIIYKLEKIICKYFTKKIGGIKILKHITTLIVIGIAVIGILKIKNIFSSKSIEPYQCDSDQKKKKKKKKNVKFNDTESSYYYDKDDTNGELLYGYYNDYNSNKYN